TSARPSPTSEASRPRLMSTRGTLPTGHKAFGRNRVRGRKRVPAPAASTRPAKLSVMETRRWTNPSQPQTLQIAVFLLYINAVFALLQGALPTPFGILLIAGGVAAGFGIATERRCGYGLGLVMAFLPFVIRLAYGSSRLG